MNKYEPLSRHLRSQKTERVILSYDDIEKILGRKLPASVHRQHWRQWWANTETHSQGQAWLKAGWRVSAPKKGEIEFRRMASRASGSPARHQAEETNDDIILLRRTDLSPGALRLLEDCADEFKKPIGAAAGYLLNRAAVERRRQLLDWFAANTKPSSITGAELVREDRDGR